MAGHRFHFTSRLIASFSSSICSGVGREERLGSGTLRSSPPTTQTRTRCRWSRLAVPPVHLPCTENSQLGGVQRPPDRRTGASQVAGRGPTNRHRHEIQNKTGGLFDEDARRRGEVAGEARAAAKCIAHWRCPPGTPACVDPILCSLSLRSASPRPSPVPVRFLQEWVWSTASLGARVWLDWMDGWTN